jgi:hypothetical protein
VPSDVRTAHLAPRPGPSRPSATDLLTTAVPQLTRLDRPVALPATGCLGIVNVDRDREREIDLARRLTAIARGATSLTPLVTLPDAAPVRRIASTWERRHGLPAGRVLLAAAPLARLDPDRRVADHSTGETAALRWSLAVTAPGPRVLVDPARGLDPAGRRHVARWLQDDVSAPTFLVSTDVEVLSRACHRVLVVEGNAVVADGAPLAVLDRLPQRPQLARLGLRAVRVSSLLPAGGRA